MEKKKNIEKFMKINRNRRTSTQTHTWFPRIWAHFLGQMCLLRAWSRHELLPGPFYCQPVGWQCLGWPMYVHRSTMRIMHWMNHVMLCHKLIMHQLLRDSTIVWLILNKRNKTINSTKFSNWGRLRVEINHKYLPERKRSWPAVSLYATKYKWW